MKPLPLLGLFCLSGGCVVTPAHVVFDDDSDRIDVEMVRDSYSENTPGARGIVLGPEAPPLAAGAFLGPVRPGAMVGPGYWGLGGGYGFGDPRSMFGPPRRLGPVHYGPAPRR